MAGRVRLGFELGSSPVVLVPSGRPVEGWCMFVYSMVARDAYPGLLY